MLPTDRQRFVVNCYCEDNLQLHITCFCNAALTTVMLHINTSRAMLLLQYIGVGLLMFMSFYSNAVAAVAQGQSKKSFTLTAICSANNATTVSGSSGENQSRSISIQTGAMKLNFSGSDGAYSLILLDQGAGSAVRGAPLSVFVGGAERTIDNNGLICNAAGPRLINGTDKNGQYCGAELECVVIANSAAKSTATATAMKQAVPLKVPAVFSFRAYTAPGAPEGLLMASLLLPAGANGTAAQGPFQKSVTSPKQFAPFPSFRIEGAFNKSAYLCYGGDKSHLFTVHRPAPGDGEAAPALSLENAQASCSDLGNGPATLLWDTAATTTATTTTPSLATTPAALVAGPASSFHLNYNRLYQLKSADDDEKNSSKSHQPLPPPPPDFPLSSPARPQQTGLCAPHTGTDYVCCDIAQVPNITSAAACCAACAKHSGCTAWKIDVNGAPQGAICYLKAGPLTNPVKVPKSVVVGWSTAPGSQPIALGFGVAGDVASVPEGFVQDTLVVHSTRGLTLAWDTWGATMRRAYNTVKRADEDPFLAALTMWTDNGAATLGAAWPAAPNTPLEPYTKLGSDAAFGGHNWSRVDTEVLGRAADAVRSAGVSPRGEQLDCWWYPIQVKGQVPLHRFWCASDWILPERWYPGNTGGVRKRTGLPLMLYLPALCPANAWNALGRYNWTDTAEEGGFVLPVAEQSEMFWGDMFDFGAALASRTVAPDAPAWPGVWVPPAVAAGWKGTNLAAYETDFYHNLMLETPQMRTQFGAGELFLGGIDAACARRNMTAQLCAGNPPSFLTALTMPSVTNARASIDYDWDGTPPKSKGPRSNNGMHNWAAPDNSWVFWATRMAPSKDNFWTSFRDLTAHGGNQDGKNGKDAELHAINALLLTGPVGLGDTCILQNTRSNSSSNSYDCMTNGTLVRRLARADGILLRPDRPLAPMDTMFSGLLLNASGAAARAMPGLCTPEQEKGPNADMANCGARLWQTHASVFPEDTAHAPELSRTPTRKLVSHAGVDATAHVTVEAAMAAQPRKLVQHLVRSVDQNDAAGFHVQLGDLYPAPEGMPSAALFADTATTHPTSPAATTTSTSTATTTNGIAADAAADSKSDLYVLWRLANDGGDSTATCLNDTDAVASGCVQLRVATMTDGEGAAAAAAATPLMDVTTSKIPCTQPPYAGGPPPAKVPAGPTCLHTHGLWQIWTARAGVTDDLIILGDLGRYVSLSGYRFRLPAQASGFGGGGDRAEGLESNGSEDTSKATGQQLVVVGMPEEIVPITYLRLKKGNNISGRTSGSRSSENTPEWVVHVQTVVIGSSGRAEVTLA